MSIHELITSEGRVVLFEIPPATPGNPVAWDNQYWGRAGESLIQLSKDKLARIFAMARSFQFEQELALDGLKREDIVELLDCNYIFQRLMIQMHTNEAFDALLKYSRPYITKNGNSYV